MTDRLFTSRLVLQPASPDQVRAIIVGDSMRASELIGAEVPIGWPEEADAREGLSWHLAAIERDGNQLRWRIRFIIETAKNALIGSVNLKGPPTQDGDVEIGWGIAVESRRHGFATEASRAVVEWAFGTGRVRRVTATVPEDNEPSQKVARRLGMMPTGEVRRGLPLWAVARG